MKKISLLILSCFVVIISLNNCITNKKTKPGTSSALSELGVYGKYVFDRENCIKCHTLNIKEANAKKISLDGQKGKRNFSWYYSYLRNPSAFEERTAKKSYDYLHSRIIEKSTFKSIYQNKENINSAWRNLTKESDSIYTLILNDLYKTPFRRKEDNYIEIFALVSYLEQIPKSKEKQRLDSIAGVARMKDENDWKSTISDTTSEFYSVVKNKKSIEEGKLIFDAKCTPCHGRNAEGVIGPNHTDIYWLHGNSVAEIATSIANGIPEKGMPAWRYELSPNEIAQIVTYIKSIEGTNLSGREPQGTKR